MASLKSQVLTLERTLKELEDLRQRVGYFLIDVLPVVLNEGFYAYTHPGAAYQIDAQEVWEMWAATWGYGLDSAFQMHKQDVEFDVWLQLRNGGPFHERKWSPWSNVLANFEAATLGQSKERQSGVWKSRSGSRNRLLLRVPHR